MEYVVICTSALVASAITLFSGFGLGTILLPVFAIFFPVNIAVALTAAVHFLNNLFKLTLLIKHVDSKIVLKFGLPAMVASLLGAAALSWLSNMKPLITYQLFNHDFRITLINLVVGILIAFFGLWEILPGLKVVSFDQKYLPVGGIFSGFFGGVSGHQGALRGAFLINTGLSKQSYISTSVVIACLVDIPRISVYLANFFLISAEKNISLLLAATISAFIGAFVANRWLKEITMKAIQTLVAIMLFVIAIALVSGLI